FSAQLGLYWNLFDFGRSYYGAQAAKNNEAAAAQAEEATLLQTTFDVKNAFYGSLAADALVAVADDSVATQQKHMQQMQGFFEVGTRTKVDLAQARADFAAATLLLARA